MIPLSQLQTDPQSLLSECCDSGRPIVVELPDHRLVAIQSIEPGDSDDSLVSEWVASKAVLQLTLLHSRWSAQH
jgi:hypothetical protein